MSEKQNKNVTVRVQKIKKNHIKQKLVFFLILAIGLVILAVFSEHLCPYDPYAQDLASALQPPSLQHPMGTDTYGRDMLSRVISGARASIFSTFILVAVIFVLGTAVGVCCGYFGGAADTVMMRISDICLAFPGLVFAMAIAAILGGGIQNAVIALAVVSWPKYSRIARGQTLALKEEPYIHAAYNNRSIIWTVWRPEFLAESVCSKKREAGKSVSSWSSSFCGGSAVNGNSWIYGSRCRISGTEPWNHQF